MLGFAILFKTRYKKLRLYIYHVLLILDLIGLTIWSLVLAYVCNDTTIPRTRKGRDEYTGLEVMITLNMSVLGHALFPRHASSSPVESSASLPPSVMLCS
jgi:hypothetical protein